MWGFGLERPDLGLGFYGKVSVQKFETGLDLGLVSEVTVSTTSLVPDLINNKKEIPGTLTSEHNEQEKEEKQKQLENDYLGISAKEEKKNIFSYGGKFCVVLFLKCFL